MSSESTIINNKISKNSLLVTNAIFIFLYLLLIFIAFLNFAQMSFLAKISYAFFGFVLISLHIFFQYVVKTTIKAEKLKTQFPNQIWKWREDWIKGYSSIKSSSLIVLFFLSFLSFFFLILGSIALYSKGFMFVKNAELNAELVISLLLVVIGLLFLVASIYQLIKFLNFSSSKFYFNSDFISMGTKVSGNLNLDSSLSKTKSIKVCLKCSRIIRTSRRGESSSYSKVLWKHEWKEKYSSGQKNINVNFEIPSDLPETKFFEVASYNKNLKNTYEQDMEAISWTIEFKIDLPTVDYNSSFEIPVLKNYNLSNATLDLESFREKQVENKKLKTEFLYLRKMKTNNDSLLFEIIPKGISKLSLMSFAVGDLFASVGAGLLYFNYSHSSMFNFVPTIIGATFILVGSIIAISAVSLFNFDTKIQITNKGLKLVKKGLFGKNSLILLKNQIGKMNIKKSMSYGDKNFYIIEIEEPQAEQARIHKLRINIPDDVEAQYISEQIKSKLAS